MGTPEVMVHADSDLLAAAAAARIVTRLTDALSARGHGHLVLTGGGIGTQVLAALAVAPARNAVDWTKVDLWWGDERFVPDGAADRNETAARAALLGVLGTDPARVHPMPGPDGPDGDNPEAAAARYAASLAAAAAGGGAFPVFDVVLLGIGPDGHVASLFPGLPAVCDDRPVVAVRDSPKPPPTRISLTFGPIRSAREVWILASGAAKAGAVARALAGDSREELPAAGARGRDRTLYLLDAAAAAGIA